MQCRQHDSRSTFLSSPRPWLLAVSVLALAIATLPAQETPDAQMEFVRKMREKGYADLALQYLAKLQKEGTPAIKALLPLEMARTRIVMARNKEPEERLALLKTARVEMQKFIDANPKTLQAVLARFDLARLVTQEGKALLNKALRHQDRNIQQQEAKKAEAQFILASKELEAAAKLLDEQSKSYSDSDPEKQKKIREQLADDARRARLEQGLNLIEQARTYIDLGKDVVLRARVKIIGSATDIFKALADEDDTNPNCVLAAAWLVRCYMESDTPVKAAAYFIAVMKQKSKAAEPAKRLARYFHIQTPFEITVKKKTDKTPKKAELAAVLEIKNEALGWLEDYGKYKDTPEGQGVRFELAKVLIKEAKLLSKDAKKGKKEKKDPPQVLALYKQAQQLLAALAESESEFADEANQLNLAVSFQRMGADTPVGRLRDFEECFLKGSYELYLVKKMGADPKEAKSRRQHFQTAIQAFQRGLQLADAKAPPVKIREARFFLATSYLLSGDLYRAAVAGEALARDQPDGKRSAAAAGYALEAYAALLARDNNEANRDRLFSIARFILIDNHKLWKNDPVTPVARYHLGMIHQQAKEYREAIEQFEQLPADYAGFIYAQGQLVLTALKARSQTRDDAEKQYYLDKTVAALNKMPQLPADTDPATAAMFFFAQIEYSRVLFTDGGQLIDKGELARAAEKYKEMSILNQKSQAQLAKAKVPPEMRSKLEFSLKVLGKVARLGRAELAYRAGKYAEVLAPDLAGGFLADIRKEVAVIEAELKKQNKPVDRIPIVDIQVAQNLLGLALRANIQLGKIDEAKTILGLIQRLTGPEGTLPANTASIFQTLIQDLDTQVKTLQKSGDRDKLKAIVTNITSFVLSKKSLDATDYFFLARCYDTLDQHCKAAEMYSKIPVPKNLNAKGKLLEKDDREIRTYWYSQMNYARQLRLCEEKDKGLRDANLKKALKILGDLLKHPNSRGQLQAQMEILLIYQDLGLYGTCINRWNKFLENPVLKKTVEEQNKKDMYYEAFYNYVLCMYKFSQDPKAKTKKDFWQKRAADFILRLESNNPDQPGEGWQFAGPKVGELLEAEPPLLAAFKDQIALHESQKAYGACVNYWKAFMSVPLFHKNPGPEERKMFFHAYAHCVQSMVNFSQEAKNKGTERETTWLKQAGDYIARLEAGKVEPAGGWQAVGPTLEKLMGTHPRLRAFYEESKKKLQK